MERTVRVVVAARGVERSPEPMEARADLELSSTRPTAPAAVVAAVAVGLELFLGWMGEAAACTAAEAAVRDGPDQATAERADRD